MTEGGQTLYIVDDEAAARASVAALASSMGIRCEAYASAESFLDRVDASCRGCALIDLRLNGLNGLELQERLATTGCTLPVVILSAYADVRATVRAMRNGALTVIQKPYQPDELAEAIREAFEVDVEIRKALARADDVRQRLGSLTAREQIVMEAVMSGKPNKIIAREMDISQRTVDRIRANLFEKMGVGTAVELARVVAETRAGAPCPEAC